MGEHNAPLFFLCLTFGENYGIIKEKVKYMKYNKRWYYNKDKGCWECPICGATVTKQPTKECPNCKTELFWNIIMDGFVPCM